MKIGILQNSDPNVSKGWIQSCEKEGLKYTIIDLTKNDWLSVINSTSFSFFVVRPFAFIEAEKTLMDERLYIISKVLNKMIYPSYEELLIHENKRLLSYFLKANNLPHPQTNVFYTVKEASNFLKSKSLPIVAKTSIGASGTGVIVLRDMTQANNYIKNAFSSQGIKRRFGPNRNTGTYENWLKKAYHNPKLLIKKLKFYKSIYKHGQRDFVIFQDFIQHDFEWRIVKIGDSYFGHKKIKEGDKASGTKGINYEVPPIKLFEFAKSICEKHNFSSMALDLFEDRSGDYLINELQTIFGHVQEYILEKNGKRGRYVNTNGTWEFEEGEFNLFESYHLRLLDAISKYEKAKH